MAIIFNVIFLLHPVCNGLLSLLGKRKVLKDFKLAINVG